MSMNISLTPELEQLVSDEVNSGRYESASDFIGEGLRLLRERDDRAGTLGLDIRAGFEGVERGEVSEYEIDDLRGLSERVKARGRERLLEQERQTSVR